MKTFLIIIGIWSLLLPSNAQDESPLLNLTKGEVYSITQRIRQDTQSEGMDSRGSASLDVHMTLDLHIIGHDSAGAIIASCRYRDLVLNLFAPSLDIAISSEDAEGATLNQYLEALQQEPFEMVLSLMGQVRKIGSLDSFIDSLGPSAASREKDRSIIRSIGEAFGEAAIISMFNISMNVRGQIVNGRIEKEVDYYFNTHPLALRNSFYVQPPSGGRQRIQGLGIFPGQEDIIEMSDRKVISSYNGNQTYDMVYDKDTHWLLEGVSRQKLFIVTEFHGYDEYPEGLRIPSRTETEFVFSGSVRQIE